MTAQTRLSAKGQVVIPKDVRDRLAWPAGTPLDVVEVAGGITLRRTTSFTEADLDAAFERLRKTVNYSGPRLDEADWKAAIDQMFDEQYRTSETS